MTIQFTPGGFPFSSSYAVNSSITAITSDGGKPVTASIAEYAAQNIGPQGPPYKTIGDGYDTTKVQIINI